MPRRLRPLVTNQVYHVFNRSIAKETIFNQKRDYQRIIDLINFYRFENPPLRYSYYNRLEIDKKGGFLKSLYTKKKLILILAFCIMPNHLHFLLKQKVENGISDFMRHMQNSYAKYFNTKYVRTGSLFQPAFKGVRVENDNQLMHVARYIHLNPATSYLVRSGQNLEDYLWSSFGTYLRKDGYSFVHTKLVYRFSKSRKSLRSFTLDQADYQKKLDRIKHIMLE